MYTFLSEQYGNSGVYQHAILNDIKEIGDNLVHEKIKYNGKSTADVLGRCSDPRRPKSSHPVGRYIRQNGIVNSDVAVRILYTNYENDTTLESKLQCFYKENYGVTHMWASASSGVAGAYSTILDLSDKLAFNEMCDMITEMKVKAEEIGYRELLEKNKRNINDYDNRRHG